jgi:hypothetical protein
MIATRGGAARSVIRIAPSLRARIAQSPDTLPYYYGQSRR